MPREFQKMIRMRGTNLDGTKRVAYALTRIRGIGDRLADLVVYKTGVDKDARLGSLSEREISRIEKFLENFEKNGVPSWLLNRRKDMHTGEDIQLIGSEIELQEKADIDRMKEMDSWKGYRHRYGLKVRGQKTRTSGRTKRAIGVRKREAIKRLRQEKRQSV